MRIKYLFLIAAVMLLTRCKKDTAPINYNCDISGNYTSAASISGNAVTSFDAIQGQPGAGFEITMHGPTNTVLNLVWYNLDSVSAENNITARTYTMPNRSAGLLAPFSVSGQYTSNITGATYITGIGSGGTITVTSNTGPGGTISGTFSFTGINAYPPYDTLRVTNGTFTKVAVATQ